jgi:hypothetical protein
MLTTIYLDDKFSLWAVKVYNVIADIFLPVELKIAYLFSPDFRPDKLFGIVILILKFRAKGLSFLLKGNIIKSPLPPFRKGGTWS